ncbi:MAG: hypothetical protein U0W24_21025 [Bacteroidales bacterium]
MKTNKNIIYLLFLLVLGFVACGDDETGQENNGNPDSNLADQYKNIDFNKQEYEIPSELVYHKKGKDFLYDKIYPIGWSKKGMFAYIIEPADEASGLYWFEIVILDIVNNKVAWSWKPKESENGNLSKTWKDNYDTFKKHLRESEIMQTKNFTLISGKSDYKGNEFELTLDATTETDPDYGFEVVKEVEINIISAELGNKKVYDQKTGDYSAILGAYIPGYLLSPFDDRIVIVFQKERVGYEGPPNVVFFDLIGSDLSRGFKKEKDS